MSRRARHGRHRRRSRASRTVGAAVPLAVGTAVAGAALIGTWADGGGLRRGDGSPAAGPPDRRGSLVTFPGESATDGRTPQPAASGIPAADRATAAGRSQRVRGADEQAISGTGGGPGTVRRQQSAPTSGPATAPGDGSAPAPGSPPPSSPPQTPPETHPPAPLPTPGVPSPPSLPPVPSVPLPSLPLP